MPYKSKGPCTYPGCNTLTLSGRCAKHSFDNDRPTPAQRGYDHNWSRLRNVYIKNNPICQIQEKCTGAPAVEVDHKLAISNGGERLDEANLQSTCKLCHAWKTATVDRLGKP